ncbi:MAG: LysM peptidoglycan-binding domain-containing protein [bacterium]|nr:MAG: LysM peptidoglycan-binding domain-containing protein [bacterium]
MKRTGYGPAAAVAALVAVFLILTSPLSAQAETVHIVQKGDTLWDISTSYLYDPFLWPQIWNVNRVIENPHLIYPGQEILIPALVARVSPPVQEAKPPLPPPPPEPVAEVKPEPPPAVPKPEPPPEPAAEEIKKKMIMALSTYGFIIEDEEIGIGTLTSSEEPRMLIRPGMKVYIKTGKRTALTAKSPYSIVRVFDKVTHPVTGAKMGYLAKVLGDLTVVDSREGLSTAIVGDVYREAKIGDHIIEHIDYLTWLPESGPGDIAGLEGYILVNPEGKKLLGKGDIVFLDLGAEDGLRTGDVLSLVEKKEKIEGVQPPLEVFGEVQVIVARPKTSVANIIRSDRDIGLGTKAVTTVE